jgi:hypothetical protein
MRKKGYAFAYAPTRPHRVTGFSGNATGVVAHDDNGNRTSRAGAPHWDEQTYAYDIEDRLTRVGGRPRDGWGRRGRVRLQCRRAAHQGAAWHPDRDQHRTVIFPQHTACGAAEPARHALHLDLPARRRFRRAPQRGAGLRGRAGGSPEGPRVQAVLEGGPEEFREA